MLKCNETYNNKGETYVAGQKQNQLSKKLNYLFDTYTKPDGTHYKSADLVRASNGVVDQSWLSRALNSDRAKVDISVLEAITKFFGISSRFWFFSLDEWIAEQAKIEAEKLEIKKNAELICKRAGLLSLETQKAVLGLMDTLEVELAKAKTV